MKKFLVAVLALIMCLSMTACGGADKQPAIDAFNEAKDAFNEVAMEVNENPDAYDQSLIDTMNKISGILQQHGEILYSDQEIEQEKLDEMIQWYEKVYEWVDQVSEALEK